MLLDFEVAHCSRRSSVSGRALAAGETYFSTLHLDGGTPVRRDFAADEWQGAGDDAIAWWRSCVPEGDAAKPKLAPSDVLLNLFVELAAQPTEAEFRYVLGLLLLRRKLVRLEETRRGAEGDVMVLDCPQREEHFELPVAAPTPERAVELERRMIELLYGGD
jgi:hypothetical protein